MSPSQTIGPFFHFALTANAALGCLTRPDAKGEHIRVRFRLVDGDGVPVPDGMIELWQADTEGKYDCGFGRLATDDQGVCVFDTVYPGRLPDGQGSHINVSVFARGLLDRLCTRVYFEGDAALAEDPVLALVPEDRRATLLARRDAEDRGQWNFEIRLQGEHETVFFDI
jgi:protocatechuate 3,4-dioxygenase, alpha subunit